MNINKYFLLFGILLLSLSCAKEQIKKSVIQEKSIDKQVVEAFEEGKKSLEEGDVLFAAKKFNEAEILFPQSTIAPKSALMAAYSYYSQDYYEDAILELKRYIKVYPTHKDLPYAYYLLGLSYYEQIVDEKKDLESIIRAKKNFELLVNKFPRTEYALDASFKIDLINDILASKEMYLARYYLEKKKWIPAINRFRTVIEEYETTIYTEEALYRLVEVYYMLGLKEESQKYAKLLGYNYQSSEWYKISYGIFNSNYKKNRRELLDKSKKNKKIISKLKSLLE